MPIMMDKTLTKAEMMRLWPIFRLFFSDETQYWHKDIVARAGEGIRGVYFFNERRAVYCCELTPSFEMEFRESTPKVTPEDEQERDALEEELRIGNIDTESVSYYHQRSIDLKKCPVIWRFTRKEWKEILQDKDWDMEEAYKEAVEKVIEYLNGNGLY